MVVIAIIGLLSSTVLASLSAARTKAKIARAKEDINSIRTAEELFLYDKGELAPLGDNCSGCSNPCDSTWTAVIDSLVTGGYLTSRIDKDPWNNYYCYDDNYKVPNCLYDSPIWSMGPNGSRDTSWANGPPTTFAGDDVGTIIEQAQC
jgi:type II secretory pathway pseudopilin PulG